MSIQSQRDMQGLAEAGRIVRRALDAMRDQVRPGITTADLDAVAAEVLHNSNARSAPNVEYGFPGTACISINEEAVHGIPGNRALSEGDLVKLDVTVEKDGYVADAAITVGVGTISEARQRLLACARAAFYRALAVARAGKRVNEIGRVVEAHVRRSGFSVIRELSGHGVGRSVHEEPSVPNYYEPRMHERLSDGLVITIEPIIAERSNAIVEERDGWTIRTKDRSASAHYEHTLVITRGRPIVLTAA
jgi:methionyl aminopeptidase